jgi:hypothetical protein
MANEPDAGHEPGTDREESTSKETSDSEGGGMPRFTLRLPQRRLDELEDLVDEGRFPTRSEAIRAGARMVVNRERGGA